MINKQFFFTAIILMAISISCTKESNLENVYNYTFEPVFTTNNTTNQLNIGDTIWLKSIVPGYLTETETNQKIYFLDAYMTINPVIRAWSLNLPTNQNQNYSITYIDTCLYQIITQNAIMSVIEYSYKNPNFELTFGVTFHKPGIYSIDFDYLKHTNYTLNTDENYGGGYIKFKDIDMIEQNGYLNPIIETNNSTNYYNELSETEKTNFQQVTQQNQNKYLFIKITDN